MYTANSVSTSAVVASLRRTWSGSAVRTTGFGHARRRGQIGDVGHHPATTQPQRQAWESGTPALVLERSPVPRSDPGVAGSPNGIRTRASTLRG